MKTSLNTQAASGTNPGADYFNFVTTGTGLVSRIRDVTGKRKSTPSVYCTISVPLDPKGAVNPRWSNFDVRVCGVDNIDLINSLRNRVANREKPAIHFTIGDVYGDAYLRTEESGERTCRAQFKGRLIRVELAQNNDRNPLKSYGLAYINPLSTSAHTGVFNLGVLHGPAEDVNYTYMNAQAANSDLGHTAYDVICDHASAENVRVLAGVELSQMFVQGFVFGEQSPKAGQLGVNVCAQLEGIKWLRVNGKAVYQRPVPLAAPDESDVNTVAPATDTPKASDTDDGDGAFASIYGTSFGHDED